MNKSLFTYGFKGGNKFANFEKLFLLDNNPKFLIAGIPFRLQLYNTPVLHSDIEIFYIVLAGILFKYSFMSDFI